MAANGATKWSPHTSTWRYDIFTVSYGYTQGGTGTSHSSLVKASARSPTPTATPEDTTPNGAIVTNLLRTVQRQTSLIEEQNRRMADLERARSSVRPGRSPSPTPSRRGQSPHPSRSRSPRHSVSVRSPSYRRRSPRRRSPRQFSPRGSSPRRSPPRRNRCSWSPFILRGHPWCPTWL